jgi:hypothetical protein
MCTPALQDMPLVARFDFPVDQSGLLPGEQCYVTVALRCAAGWLLYGLCSGASALHTNAPCLCALYPGATVPQGPCAPMHVPRWPRVCNVLSCLRQCDSMGRCCTCLLVLALRACSSAAHQRRTDSAPQATLAAACSCTCAALCGGDAADAHRCLRARRFGGAEVVVEVLQEPPARVPRVSLLRPLDSPGDSCSSRSGSSSGSSEKGTAYTARSHVSEELQGCSSADRSVLSSAAGSVAAEEAEAGEEVASVVAAGTASSKAAAGGGAADVPPCQATVVKGTGVAAVVAGEAAGGAGAGPGAGDHDDAAQLRDQAAAGEAASSEPAGSSGLASGSQAADVEGVAGSCCGAARLAAGEPSQAAAEDGCQEEAAPAWDAAAAAAAAAAAEEEECAEEHAMQCTEATAQESTEDLR